MPFFVSITRIYSFAYLTWQEGFERLFLHIGDAQLSLPGFSANKRRSESLDESENRFIIDLQGACRLAWIRHRSG